jgi:DNA-binding transcriptional ArsR family regulator
MVGKKKVISPDTKWFQLHPRRLAILRFVGQFCRDHDYCPDTREVMIAAQISSTSVARYHIDALRDAGLLDALVLETGFVAPRTIHVTEAGVKMLDSIPTKGGDKSGKRS